MGYPEGLCELPEDSDGILSTIYWAVVFILGALYLLYNKTSNVSSISGMKDSVYIYSRTRGLGELFWNLCTVCGCASIRTTLWENGYLEHGECMTCNRMRELMELEELFAKTER